MQKSKIVLIIGIVFIIYAIFSTIGFAVLVQHNQHNDTQFIRLLLSYFGGISLIALWGFIKKSKQ